MTVVKESVERFVEKLTAAGWQLRAADEWRQHYERGIPLELMLARAGGDLFITHPRGEDRVSVSVTDSEAAEYVEFGFDYGSIAELESALHALIAVQQDVVPQSVPALLRMLLDQQLSLRWEEQEEELEPVTAANLDSKPYTMPLMG